MRSSPTTSGSGGIDQLIDLPVNGVLRYVFGATVSAGSLFGNGFENPAQGISVPVPPECVRRAMAWESAPNQDTQGLPPLESARDLDENSILGPKLHLVVLGNLRHGVVL